MSGIVNKLWVPAMHDRATGVAPEASGFWITAE